MHDHDVNFYSYGKRKENYLLLHKRVVRKRRKSHVMDDGGSCSEKAQSSSFRIPQFPFFFFFLNS